MARQPAPQTFWGHVGNMPMWTNILVVLGLVAFGSAWFTPRLLNPARDDGRACERQEGKGAEPTGDKFRIVAIQPVDFRRQDAVCVTVENVVSRDGSARAKEEEAGAQKLLDTSEAAQKAAEDKAFKASAAALPTAKLEVDVTTARTDAARKARDALVAARLKPGEKRHYTLYLNGKKSPFFADADPVSGQQMLVFRLEDTVDASSELGTFWRNAITRPIIDGKLDAHLGLGDATGSVVPYVASDKEVVNRVVMYSRWVRSLASFALFAMLLWLVILAIRTPLLRAGDVLESGFSLARVQMMFWLVLVSGGYLYIWFVVGQWLNVMNSATFALLGISGVAAGAALTVDGAKNQQAPGAPPVPAVALPPSRGFFWDIASDPAGIVQLQRIQMILWTLILGVIFVWSVAIKLELPPFDSNLLALAGIVNGVYVALKTQEPASPPPPPPPAIGGAIDPDKAGPS